MTSIPTLNKKKKIDNLRSKIFDIFEKKNRHTRKSIRKRACFSGGGEMVQLAGHPHRGAGLGTGYQGHTDLRVLPTLRARYDKEATG